MEINDTEAEQGVELEPQEPQEVDVELNADEPKPDDSTEQTTETEDFELTFDGEALSLADDDVDEDDDFGVDEDSMSEPFKRVRDDRREKVRALKEAQRRELEQKQQMLQLQQQLEQLQKAQAEGGQSQNAQSYEGDLWIDEIHPTLEDYDHDEEAHSKALAESVKRQTLKEQQRQQVQNLQQQRQQEIAASYQKIQESKKTFAKPDMDLIEVQVAQQFNDDQRIMAIEALGEEQHAAQKLYVLGKNPQVVQDLASTQDPYKFALKLGRTLEKIKVNPGKKPATAPEKRVSSTSGSASSGEAHLEKLRQKAERTGNMNEFMAARRKLRAKQRGA